MVTEPVLATVDGVAEAIQDHPDWLELPVQPDDGDEHGGLHPDDALALDIRAFLAFVDDTLAGNESQK